jgi:hypothetical protein
MMKLLAGFLYAALALADGPIGTSIVVQNGGVTQGGTVILNCDGSTVVCDLAAGKVTLHSTGGGIGGTVNAQLYQVVSGNGTANQVQNAAGLVEFSEYTNPALSSLTACVTCSQAIGNGALSVLASGLSDVGDGPFALFSLTTGMGNLAEGAFALYSLTSGCFNAALGSGAAGSLVSGSSNFALGTGALSLLTAGSSNLAVGTNALQSLALGNNNVDLGNDDLLTCGDCNVLIGLNLTVVTPTGSNQLNIADTLLANTSTKLFQWPGYTGTGSRPVCVTATGGVEAGTISAGLVMCP